MFLQRPVFMRALIVAMLYVDKGWSREAIARFLGIGYSTCCMYLNQSLEFEWSDDDFNEAARLIEQFDTPLYVTRW